LARRRRDWQVSHTAPSALRALTGRSRPQPTHAATRLGLHDEQMGVPVLA
jgi:hypothetical protein